MTDFYLNTKTAETFESLKSSTPFEYGEGGVVGSEGWNIDIIGDGQMRVVSWDSEGVPTMGPIGGFLINLRSDNALPEALKQYQVYPVTPIRVWA